MNDKIYTAISAGDVLNLKPATVRQYARSGELKGYKKGKRWFFLHSDLVAWIKGK